MRTYGKTSTAKTPANAKQRGTREAYEWDIRIDISEKQTVERLIGYISKLDVVYALISGIESPDENQSWGSKENHVHIAIVLSEPKTRAEVLTMCRGQRKLTEEYAAPRNPKFTYAGWFIHHVKLATKLPGEPRKHLDIGCLPMDPFTLESAEKINRIQEKYGDEYTKQLFSGYFDIIDDAALDHALKIQDKLLEASNE